MSDIAIRVKNLGKQYHIGALQKNGGGYSYKSLRDTIANAATAPFRAARALMGQKDARQNHQDNTIWALKDVSFDVKKGEIVGVIGRNGAGKSTLLKLLSRITEPTTGRVEIHGRVGSLLEVGTGFHPELSGRDNVYLNGAILGMKRAEIAKNFDAIVAFAGVERFIDTPVKHYSSGMYLRLAFAVAAHLQTEVLIVDEVLAVGDAEFQKKCLGKMREVSTGEGRTVLFVSHNMSAILQLCDRGILLRSGTLGLDGPCEMVASNYLSDAYESSGGQIDLRNHPARLPSCRPILSQITMRNGSGEAASQFFPDEAIAIEIVANPPSIVKAPMFAIAIEDSQGRRLMTFASYFNHANSKFSSVATNAVARCEIGQLSLAPGRYLLSVSLSTKHDGLLDSIDGLAWFEVVWNNNYADGEPYLSVYGPVLKESRWTLITEN